MMDSDVVFTYLRAGGVLCKGCVAVAVWGVYVWWLRECVVASCNARRSSVPCSVNINRPLLPVLSCGWVLLLL